MNIGDIVNDKKPEYNGDAVIVEFLDEKASEVIIPNTDKTVADVNQDIANENSEVVRVVFKYNLESKIPKWWLLNEDNFTRKIESHNIKSYYYPIERLEKKQDGLLNGLIVPVTSVIDPFNKKKGAYTYDIYDVNNNIIYSESDTISKNNGNHVTKREVKLIGISNAIDWIAENRDEQALQIRIDKSKEINSIMRNLSHNKAVKNLISEINKKTNKLKRIEYTEIRSSRKESLHQKAIDTYKRSENDGTEFNIDKVIENEYIVNSVYSVNTSDSTCTCNKDGLCEHIEAVLEHNDKSELSN